MLSIVAGRIILAVGSRAGDCDGGDGGGGEGGEDAMRASSPCEKSV